MKALIIGGSGLTDFTSLLASPRPGTSLPVYVRGRPAVAVAARCSRLQAAATLLMQDGVISGV